jgi:ankyrin repeat protein
VKKKLKNKKKMEEHLNENFADSCSQGNYEKAKNYLNLGSDPNYVSYKYDSLSVLHLATKFDHKEIVKLLLEHKADTEVKDKYGRKPIFYARHSCLKLMIDHSPCEKKDINEICKCNVSLISH